MATNEVLTFKQLNYLVALQDTEKAQITARNWLREHHKLEDISRLTKREASELIDLLLKMR